MPDVNKNWEEIEMSQEIKEADRGCLGEWLAMLGHLAGWGLMMVGIPWTAIGMVEVAAGNKEGPYLIKPILLLIGGFVLNWLTRQWDHKYEKINQELYRKAREEEIAEQRKKEEEELRRQKERKIERLYKKCLDEKINDFETSANLQKAQLIAKSLGLDEYESKSSFENMYTEQKEKQNKKLQEERTEKLRELKEKENEEKKEIEKYSDLFGREKIIKYFDDLMVEPQKIADKEEAFQKYVSTLPTVYRALADSVTTTRPQKSDWAVAGGFASAIAGPAAGLAVANDIQNKNAQKDAEYEKAKIQAELHREELRDKARKEPEKLLKEHDSSAAYKAERELVKYRRMKEKAEILLVEERNPEELLKMLKPRVVKQIVSETGTVELKVSVRGKQDIMIYENVESVIDGSFEVVLYDENDKKCGTAKVTLPYNGAFDNLVIQSLCTETLQTERKEKYRCTFDKPNLWLIEKIGEY